EEQRLKKANELKKQKKALIQPKKEVQQKSIPSKPSVTAPTKPSADVKKPALKISFEDLMRYAALKNNKKPIPKELAHVATASRTNNTSTPSSSSNKSS
ncbi:unnamed protein product, partial [Adineta steineri]